MRDLIVAKNEVMLRPFYLMGNQLILDQNHGDFMEAGTKPIAPSKDPAATILSVTGDASFLPPCCRVAVIVSNRNSTKTLFDMIGVHLSRF